VYGANELQYLVELCTLLVEDVLGPFFAVSRTHIPVPVHPLTRPYAAYFLCARHIWPARSDPACSKMSTSSSPNPTWSCRPDTGAAHLPPYLFRSTNILRSQSPGGLRPYQEWENHSSRSRDPWRGRGPCRSTYLVCRPSDRERPAKVLEAVSWRP
jgi:hypothetical protein